MNIITSPFALGLILLSRYIHFLNVVSMTKGFVAIIHLYINLINSVVASSKQNDHLQNPIMSLIR